MSSDHRTHGPVSMCAYVHVNVCTCVCVFVCIHVCDGTHVYVNACTHVCVRVCTNVCVRTHVLAPSHARPVCMYVMYICIMYVCTCARTMHVYVCMYVLYIQCLYACMYVCTSAGMHACMHLRMYVRDSFEKHTSSEKKILPPVTQTYVHTNKYK